MSESTVYAPLPWDPPRGKRVTPEMVRADPEINGLVVMSDKYLEAIGYTDHGWNHVDRVAARAHRILEELEYPARMAELSAIASYLHDMGNVIHRQGHQQYGALLALPILQRLGMPIEEAAVVAGAIANHDESNGELFSPIGAALIIADKADVLRTRVRNPKMISHDIHDRVNFATESSELTVDVPGRIITLQLKIDTSISTVMEYFEIFLLRMGITRRAAAFLRCHFKLVINEVELS